MPKMIFVNLPVADLNRSIDKGETVVISVGKTDYGGDDDDDGGQSADVPSPTRPEVWNRN